MTDGTFTTVDALIAAIDHVTKTDTARSAKNDLGFGTPARLDALSISTTGIHAVELTSESETELLDHLVEKHLPLLAFRLAGVGFWVTEHNTGRLNFTASTLARWFLADIAQTALEATQDDHTHATTILTEPRLFPEISGTCLITGIDTDAAHPVALDATFATWLGGKLHTVRQQSDPMMRDRLSDLGLPGTDS
jgi:hypothetical protein